MNRIHTRLLKWRTAAVFLLTVSCIGMALSGCTADKKQADKTENRLEDGSGTTADYTGGGQSITDAEPSAGQTPQVPAATDDAPAAAQETQEENPESQDEAAAPDSGNLYERFLNNEIPASVSSSYPDPDYVNAIIEKGASYTLTELGDRVSEYFLNPENTDKTSYDMIQYTYISCPDSTAGDTRNLLVKFVGLNIYSPDDDSYVVFVVTEAEGQLFITYDYQCWARSVTIANSNGTLRDFGSGGAGVHYDGQSVILSDGTKNSIYAAEILGGWWTSYVNDAIYNEVFGADMEPGGFMVSIYTIGTDQYYRYDMGECTEEQKILCEDYINRCRDEQGISWVTEEEIEAAVKDRCSVLGIDYGITQNQQEAVWNTL